MNWIVLPHLLQLGPFRWYSVKEAFLESASASGERGKPRRIILSDTVSPDELSTSSTDLERQKSFWSFFGLASTEETKSIAAIAGC